jgi:DNA-binding CsgD family transcriptional regulator
MTAPLQGMGDVDAGIAVTPPPVRNYVSSIFAKIDVAGRPEAIVTGREAGLGR